MLTPSVSCWQARQNARCSGKGLAASQSRTMRGTWSPNRWRKCMRLLLTCHRDPFSYVGGSETVVRALAMQLSQRGHEVTVLTKREPSVPYHALYHNKDGERLQMLIGPEPKVINVLTFEPNGKGPLET